MAQPSLWTQWKLCFPQPAHSVGEGSGFLLVQPCSGEGCQAQRSQLSPWSCVLGDSKASVGNGACHSWQTSRAGMLTALGVTEGKASDQTRIINTVTQQNSEPRDWTPLGADLPMTLGLLVQAEQWCLSPPTSSCAASPSFAPFLQWDLNLGRRSDGVGGKRGAGNCKCVSEFFSLHLEQRWLYSFDMPVMEPIP